MNTCVLMAKIVKDPELRYTAENQTPLTEMLVQFPGLRAEDPAETLKVVGWGNLAQQIQEQFHQGDHVVIEGRLGMNTIERPEGFKEKRAEFTATRVHPIVADNGFETTVSSSPRSAEKARSVADSSPPSAEKPEGLVASSPPSAEKQKVAPKPAEADLNYDDIPF